LYIEFAGTGYTRCDSSGCASIGFGAALRETVVVELAPAAEIKMAVTKTIEEHRRNITPEHKSTTDRTGIPTANHIRTY
jgi:hypothetical protein